MSDESEWVVAPDEARIEIAIGTEAKISPEVRQALDQLAQTLEGRDEVQGYFFCKDVTVGTCLTFISCRGVG